MIAPFTLQQEEILCKHVEVGGRPRAEVPCFKIG